MRLSERLTLVETLIDTAIEDKINPFLEALLMCLSLQKKLRPRGRSGTLNTQGEKVECRVQISDCSSYFLLTILYLTSDPISSVISFHWSGSCHLAAIRHYCTSEDWGMGYSEQKGNLDPFQFMFI